MAYAAFRVVALTPPRTGLGTDLTEEVWKELRRNGTHPQWRYRTRLGLCDTLTVLAQLHGGPDLPGELARITQAFAHESANMVLFYAWTEEPAGGGKSKPQFVLQCTAEMDDFQARRLAAHFNERKERNAEYSSWPIPKAHAVKRSRQCQ